MTCFVVEQFFTWKDYARNESVLKAFMELNEHCDLQWRDKLFIFISYSTYYSTGAVAEQDDFWDQTDDDLDAAK